MAKIPSQVIENLYYKSRANPGRWFSAGRGYEIYTYPDGRMKLTNYGTVIYRYDPSSRTYDVGGAYSPSDRNAINSMAALTGVGGAKIRDRKLQAYGPGHDRSLSFNEKSDIYAARRKKLAFWRR